MPRGGWKTANQHNVGCCLLYEPPPGRVNCPAAIRAEEMFGEKFAGKSSGSGCLDRRWCDRATIGGSSKSRPRDERSVLDPRLNRSRGIRPLYNAGGDRQSMPPWPKSPAIVCARRSEFPRDQDRKKRRVASQICRHEPARNEHAVVKIGALDVGDSPASLVQG